MAIRGGMRVRVNSAHAQKVIKNAADYTEGYAATLKENQETLMHKIGLAGVQAIGAYVDKMAAGNPEALHHVYEWGGIGSARLFDFEYTATPKSVSFTQGEFRQSSTVGPGGGHVFAEKAKVMEENDSVDISPQFSPVLVFEYEGETVVTSSTVTVNPGGPATTGAFQRVVDAFFKEYVTQSFLAPVLAAIARSQSWQAGFPNGARGGGRAAGVAAAVKQMESVAVEGFG